MPRYLSQITGADTQLLGIESNVAVKVMKTIDSIEKQIIEFAAAAAVLSIALWELAQITARMEHGFVGVLATTEIISQCRRQLVGLAVLANG